VFATNTSSFLLPHF